MKEHESIELKEGQTYGWLAYTGKIVTDVLCGYDKAIVNSENLLHNLYGFAFADYDGHFYRLEYYINGYQYSKEEWLYNSDIIKNRIEMLKNI